MSRTERVKEAHARAENAGFPLSCEDVAGAMLAALAAATPPSGRILELGTGAGVGLAWLIEGLGEREDVQITTVDLDPEIQTLCRSAGWPAFVRFELGDGAELVDALGTFDLIFADAPGGKLINLEGSVAALRPGGVLLVDDMDLAQHEDEKLRQSLATVRDTLLSDPRLVNVELAAGSGLLVSTRRRSLS